MAKLITRKYTIQGEKAANKGKTYGRIVHTETLDTDMFASHIASHGSPFDRSTISGVLMAACDCLMELALDSKKIRLGDLGTFYMTAETEGEDVADDFSADNIKAVHLRFLPNLKHSYPLDSKSIRKKASFTDLESLIEGKKASEQGSSPSGGNTGDGTNQGGNSGGGTSQGGGTTTGGDEPGEDRP